MDDGSANIFFFYSLTEQMSPKLDFRSDQDLSKSIPLSLEMMRKTPETRGGPIAISAINFLVTADLCFPGKRLSRKEYHMWPKSPK